MEESEEIKIPSCTCQRCGYIWRPRVVKPRKCPECKSPYWNKPRKREMKKNEQ